MFRAEIIHERVPIVWILVGLLFQASGLYLGFDYSLAFLFMIIGAFCFAFGVAILVFRMREKPKASEKTRLSPQFISAGATQVMPSPKTQEDVPAEQAADEQPAG